MTNHHIEHLIDLGLFDVLHRIKSSRLINKVEIEEYLQLNTDFLPITASISERVYCLKNNITNLSVCLNCANPVKFTINKYQQFCSTSCARSSNLTKQKVKDTNQLRYGVDNVSQLLQTKQKVKDTNIKVLGVDNPFKSLIIQEKIRQSNITRHGVQYALQSAELLQKAKETNIERYGVGNAMQNIEIQQKAKKTNIIQLGVDNPFKSLIIQEKIKETNIEKYGVDNPFKSLIIQEKIKETNIAKYGTKYFSQKNIIDNDNMSKLLSIDYFKREHHNEQKSIVEIATELHVSPITARKYINSHNITINSYSGSLGQTQLYQFIKSIYNGNIITNYKIQNHEIDIYLPEYNLGFEYNGLYWHSELAGRDKWYHNNKTNWCINNNIRLIQIWECEWIHKQCIIMMIIKSTLLPDYIKAESYNMIEILPEQAALFFDDHHIEGFMPAYIYIGGYINEILVSAISVTANYELIQHISNNINLKLMIDYYINTHNPPNIVYYLNKRYESLVDFYNQGFIYSSYISPEYYYFNYRSTQLSVNQNIELYTTLHEIDDSISEWENMQLSKFNRVWDCGKYKLILTNNKKP